jgi:hypothetical protein
VSQVSRVDPQAQTFNPSSTIWHPKRLTFFVGPLLSLLARMSPPAALSQVFFADNALVLDDMNNLGFVTVWQPKLACLRVCR